MTLPQWWWRFLPDGQPTWTSAPLRRLPRADNAVQMYELDGLGPAGPVSGDTAHYHLQLEYVRRAGLAPASLPALLQAMEMLDEDRASTEALLAARDTLPGLTWRVRAVRQARVGALAGVTVRAAASARVGLGELVVCVDADGRWGAARHAVPLGVWMGWEVAWRSSAVEALGPLAPP